MDVVRKYAKTHVIDSSELTRIVSDQFRAQPIVVPGTLKVLGFELLHRSPLAFSSIENMVLVDILALEYATMLSRYCGYTQRIHCNVEVSSFIDLRWRNAMVEMMCPSVVIEIVERNELLSNKVILRRAKFIADAIRNFGGQVALDDCSCTPLELRTMDALNPEIVKIECAHRIEKVRNNSNAKLLVERIETEIQADKALRMGADELQGYWCDVQVVDFLPEEFTPPGVAELKRLGFGFAS